VTAGREAESAMSTEGIRDPERIAAMILPGRWERSPTKS
jgi:hypothetical protein